MNKETKRVIKEEKERIERSRAATLEEIDEMIADLLQLKENFGKIHGYVLSGRFDAIAGRSARLSQWALRDYEKTRLLSYIEGMEENE